MSKASTRRQIEQEVGRWLASARSNHPSPAWMIAMFSWRRINLLRRVGKESRKRQ
jgi:hypothetical protein